MTFGEFIRKRRLEKGYTLRGFSALVGLSPTFTSHMERDRVDSPSEEKINIIAKVLGIEEESLVFMAKRMPKNVKEMIINRPELAEFLKIISTKNSQELELIMKYAER